MSTAAVGAAVSTTPSSRNAPPPRAPSRADAYFGPSPSSANRAARSDAQPPTPTSGARSSNTYDPSAAPSMPDGSANGLPIVDQVESGGLPVVIETRSDVQPGILVPSLGLTPLPAFDDPSDVGLDALDPENDTSPVQPVSNPPPSGGGCCDGCGCVIS